MAKKKYNKFVKVIIFLMALFLLISFFDGIMEVKIGEASLNLPQLFRISFSVILSVLYVYISCFTKELDKKFKLKLYDSNRFFFLLFILILIFLTFMLLTPAS